MGWGGVGIGVDALPKDPFQLPEIMTKQQTSVFQNVFPSIYCFQRWCFGK